MPQQIPIRKELFVEDAHGWKLIGNKCKACGQVFFPKTKTICLNCYNEELIDIQFGQKGKLYTFTTAEVPSEHFTPPYSCGYVIFDNNIKVFSQLEALKDKPFKIGMEMQLIIGTLWQEGENEMIGYKYIPI